MRRASETGEVAAEEGKRQGEAPVGVASEQSEDEETPEDHIGWQLWS